MNYKDIPGEEGFLKKSLKMYLLALNMFAKILLISH